MKRDDVRDCLLWDLARSILAVPTVLVQLYSPQKYNLEHITCHVLISRLLLLLQH